MPVYLFYYLRAKRNVFVSQLSGVKDLLSESNCDPRQWDSVLVTPCLKGCMPKNLKPVHLVAVFLPQFV